MSPKLFQVPELQRHFVRIYKILNVYGNKDISGFCVFIFVLLFSLLKAGAPDIKMKEVQRIWEKIRTSAGFS
jgi:hypothetical protein